MAGIDSTAYDAYLNNFYKKQAYEQSKLANINQMMQMYMDDSTKNRQIDTQRQTALDTTSMSNEAQIAAARIQSDPQLLKNLLDAVEAGLPSESIMGHFGIDVNDPGVQQMIHGARAAKNAKYKEDATRSTAQTSAINFLQNGSKPTGDGFGTGNPAADTQLGITAMFPNAAGQLGQFAQQTALGGQYTGAKQDNFNDINSGMAVSPKDKLVADTQRFVAMQNQHGGSGMYGDFDPNKLIGKSITLPSGKVVPTQMAKEKSFELAQQVTVFNNELKAEYAELARLKNNLADMQKNRPEAVAQAKDPTFGVAAQQDKVTKLIEKIHAAMADHAALVDGIKQSSKEDLNNSWNGPEQGPQQPQDQQGQPSLLGSGLFGGIKY